MTPHGGGTGLQGAPHTHLYSSSAIPPHAASKPREDGLTEDNTSGKPDLRAVRCNRVHGQSLRARSACYMAHEAQLAPPIAKCARFACMAPSIALLLACRAPTTYRCTNGVRSAATNCQASASSPVDGLASAPQHLGGFVRDRSSVSLRGSWQRLCNRRTSLRLASRALCARCGLSKRASSRERGPRGPRGLARSWASRPNRVRGGWGPTRRAVRGCSGCAGVEHVAYPSLLSCHCELSFGWQGQGRPQHMQHAPQLINTCFAGQSAEISVHRIYQPQLTIGPALG